MSVDIYSVCPCGSGKKLKFCCHAVADEMDRAIRLVEGNQPRVALQQLETLAKKHPLNAWIDTTRGMLLLDLNEGVAARDLLRTLLEEYPDNDLAIVLYAAAMVQAEGFDLAKRALHRAFQRSAKKLPTLVGDLASSVAESHATRGQMMAAREHLALSLRLAPEEKRQQQFVQLLELDGADSIPYPLRGSHQLPSISGSDDLQKEVRKAQKYAAVGCWSVAAEVFLSLTNATPDSAELWHSVGLCRAWDGNEKGAAEALHRAARHYNDLGVAVECETIAQILDEKTTTDVVEQCTFKANLQSVSRLLTVLDGQAKMARQQITLDADDENPVVASYWVLSSDAANADNENATLDNIPRILGVISIFDADPKNNQPAYLLATGYRGIALDDCKSILTSAAGDLIEWRTDVSQPEITGKIPAESIGFDMNWYLGGNLSPVNRRELFTRFWKQVVDEKWTNRPLRALDGKTPVQAAGDESLKVPLLGAVYALDAAAQYREMEIDLKNLLVRIGISPLPALKVTPETNIGGLSIMQLNRLVPSELSDQQLATVVNRSMLIRHNETLYEVLKTAMDRPDCGHQYDLPRILRTLCELCSMKRQRAEAISWIERGRNLPAADGKTAFQHAWSWDMVELGVRLEDPNDPQLKVLLDRFVHYYTPKVPQVRPHIEQMLQKFGVPSPWESMGITLPGSVSTPSSSVWSPGVAEPAASGGSRLWLPGQ